MIERRQDSDAGTDATAHQDGAVDPQIPHDTDDVAAHRLEGEGLGHLARPAIAADVDTDDGEPGGEMGRLVQPEIAVERIGMDEDERGPATPNLVPDVDPLRAAVGHSALPNLLCAHQSPYVILGWQQRMTKKWQTPNGRSVRSNSPTAIALMAVPASSTRCPRTDSVRP